MRNEYWVIVFIIALALVTNIIITLDTSNKAADRIVNAIKANPAQIQRVAVEVKDDKETLEGFHNIIQHKLSVLEASLGVEKLETITSPDGKVVFILFPTQAKNEKPTPTPILIPENDNP